MYRHTQIGYLILGVSAGVGVLLLVSTVPGPFLWIALAVFLGLAVLFGSLTSEVTQDHFVFWFGPGFIRRSFLLSDIDSCAPVLNPWIYGWGIHWTPDGWLYNVSGTQAVELQLRGGRKVRVGTDAPAELCRAILRMKGAA